MTDVFHMSAVLAIGKHCMCLKDEKTDDFIRNLLKDTWSEGPAIELKHASRRLVFIGCLFRVSGLPSQPNG